jgi:hypothetical protein
MLKVIGTTFPNHWQWSKYEQRCLDSIKSQIDKLYPDNQNLLINLTWFGPQFENEQWQNYKKLIGQKFDNLFLLATVDPAMITVSQIDSMVQELGYPRLFKMGNFDTQYHFNFFAPMLQDLFIKYQDEDIMLKSVKWLYINYNRKPRRHRVELVRKLQENKIDNLGIITLGKPNIIYDQDPNNTLYLSLGKNPKDYVHAGHWLDANKEDPFGIPHDVLSLHDLYYWQNHFLYVIGATEFHVWDDIFVSETQFKPMIGLRPFLINGNPRTYEWLTNNGFKTFGKYFPEIDFTDPNSVHDAIIQTIIQLSHMTKSEIMSLYNDMLPDLLYNRERFYEYANEQKKLIDNLL